MNIFQEILDWLISILGPAADVAVLAFIALIVQLFSVIGGLF